MAFPRRLAFVAAVIWLCGPAYSQEERRPYFLGHAVENFAYVLHEVCLPYLFDGVDPRAWLGARRRSWVAWFPPGGPFAGLQTYLIGGGEGAQVGLGEGDGSRRCVVKGDSANPEDYLSATDSFIADLGVPMAPSAIALPASPSAEHRWLCSTDPARPLGLIISFSPNAERRRMFLATLITSPCEAAQPSADE